MKKYDCWIDDPSRDDHRSIAATDLRRAAEAFADQIFHAWAWESSSLAYPMRVVVFDGAEKVLFLVELGQVPVWFARLLMEPIATRKALRNSLPRKALCVPPPGLEPGTL